MSVSMFAYLEASDTQAQPAWHCITHQDSFDGFDFNNHELLPDITYPINPQTFKQITQAFTGLHPIPANELSPTLYAEYQNLSNQVTGSDNGLTIYTITIGDLINSYNHLIKLVNQTNGQAKQSYQTSLTLTANSIRRLTNSYYYQLDITGDPYLLNPDGHHPIQISRLIADRVRVVLWFDA